MSDASATIGTVRPATLDEGHPRKWLILAAVSLGMFMALLDVTIVNIAIPAIISDLHTTVTHVSWVLNAYSLVLAALFLSMGRVSDRFGQKRVFVAGLVAFTVFSLLCGLAPNIGWLIAFRAGQGIGGAALSTVSLAIVLGAFPKRQQGTAVGLWGALGTIAAAIGPTLGGLLVTYASWHWIFFVNVPIGIAALVFALLVIPEHRREGASGGIDMPGHRDLRGRPLPAHPGPDRGQRLGLDLGPHPRPVRRRDRLLPAVHLVGAAHQGADVPRQAAAHPLVHGGQQRHDVHRHGHGRHLPAGRHLPRLGARLLRAARRAGADRDAGDRLLHRAQRRAGSIDRIGPRLPAAVGAAFFTVGLVLLAQLGGSTKLVDVLWRVVFVGAGMGFAMPTLSAAAMGSLPPQVRGVGSGALNTLRQVGFTLGIAVLVAIFSHSVAANAQTATRRRSPT